MKDVLLDTGSAGTIFSADAVDDVGVKIEPGEAVLSAFEVEIGDMNYGMEIDGILGFDFIRSAGLVIDSKELTVLIKN